MNDMELHEMESCPQTTEIPPQAPAAGMPQQAPAVKPVPVRRTGNITLGVGLIVTGICICLYYFVPSFDLLFVAKLAPLILVLLGAEILWANARKGDAKLKYSVLSMFFCFLLICASLAVGIFPFFWHQYGPDQYNTEQRLSHEIQQTLADSLPAGVVQDGYVLVDLNQMNYSDDITPSQLTDADFVSVDLTLADSFYDAQSFADACLSLMQSMPNLHYNSISFVSEDADNRWTLHVNSPFAQKLSSQQLAQMVEHYTLTPAESDSTAETSLE